MHYQHEQRPDFVHWEAALGSAGAAPGRAGFSSIRRPTRSWTAREAEPTPAFSAASQRRAPRVPSYLPRFAVAGGAKVLGRSGAEPISESSQRRLHTARANLGSSGRMRGGLPRPREAMPFPGPPGMVGKLRSNSALQGLPKRVALSPRARMLQAFQNGDFSKAVEETKVKAAFNVAKLAQEQMLRRRREVEAKRKELEALQQALRAAFRSIDEDGSGHVEPTEVLKLVKAGKHTVDEKGFWDNFAKADTDRNGLIDEAEFLQLLTKDVRAQSSPRPCARSFALFVCAHDGFGFVSCRCTARSRRLTRSLLRARPPSTRRMPPQTTWRRRRQTRPWLRRRRARRGQIAGTAHAAGARRGTITAARRTNGRPHTNEG